MGLVLRWISGIILTLLVILIVCIAIGCIIKLYLVKWTVRSEFNRAKPAYAEAVVDAVADYLDG